MFLEQSSLVERFHLFLTTQGTTPGNQLFPHRPDCFLDRFPTRLADNLSETLLLEKLWWWRYADVANATVIFPPWDAADDWWPQFMLTVFSDYLERSAFFYELRARYEERNEWEFGKPWVRCSVEQHRFLHCLLPNIDPPKHALHLDKRESGWTYLKDFPVNLRLSDKTLHRQFKELVRNERHRAGISKPGAGHGTRRKPISWRSLELMDLRRYGLRTLSNSESSQISKVKKAYAERCTALGLTL
ncbi:MAG: hypothetical protein EOP84_03860 [Verrucomicrobiaceae bacterium]|nr:MAG: hypothetical protein EOP84_03860 [Verrucomicrobiaceae bacterium]